MEEQTRKNPKEKTNPKPTEKEMENSSHYIIDISNDLVEEILQELPVKSLIRFKSVSKQWRSTIQCKGFVERHLIRQKSRTSKILSSSVSGTGEDDVCLTSLSVEDGEQIYRSYTHSDHFHPPLRFPGSCNGLVCVYDEVSIYIINPTTREIRKLPPTNSQIRSNDSNPSVMQDIPLSMIGFGRDNVTGTYKVIRLYMEPDPNMSNIQVQDENRRTKSEVFALDTGVWRCIDPIPYEISSRQRPVYANGLLFWFTKQIHPTLLAFDLHTEIFHATPYPGFYDEPNLSIYMYSRSDRLHAVTLGWCFIKIWGLNPNGEWEILRKKCFESVPQETRRQKTRPSIVASHYIREKLPLPYFHTQLLLRYPELLCNLLCKDHEISYIESLVSVYQ